MAKKYVRIKVWEETAKNMRLKKTRIDEDLKNIGMKRRMPMTRVYHLASLKPIFLDMEDIKRISRRKKFEI